MKTHLEFKIYFFFALLLGFVHTASAQLTFTSGADPLAGPNGDDPSAEFYNFSNGGGQGALSVGTVSNLRGSTTEHWVQTTSPFYFTYDPAFGFEEASLSPGSGTGLFSPLPDVPPTELQITVNNTGIGNLTLTLNSINSVGYGGTAGPGGIAGGTENFASGTTWSAANGNIYQAYLNNPALFSSGFTLYGTITLDSPANSANYGDNLNSLIEMSLAPTPEPSTGVLFGGWFGSRSLFAAQKVSFIQLRGAWPGWYGGS